MSVEITYKKFQITCKNEPQIQYIHIFFIKVEFLVILPLDLNLFLNQSAKQKLCVIKDKEYKIIWPWQMAMHIEITVFYREIFNE